LFAKNYALVADIGGTNANFAVMDNDKIVYSRSFKCSQMRSFEDLFQSFLMLDEVKKYRIIKACLAIAGIVSSDRTFANFTNLPWMVDINVLKKFNIGKVLLLNDFESLGYAYDVMNPTQYVELSSIGRNSVGTAAIIGAGTGLGTCILTYQRGLHMPMSSEGGHTTLNIDPTDKLEVQLYSYLKSRHIVLDNESLISGPGILNIYNFLLSKKLKHNKKVAQEIKNAAVEHWPSLITKYAMEEQDYLCLKVVELFIIFFARAAKNLCINALCSELVIAGGIAPNILPLMQESFMEAFTAHDRKHIRNLLENVTVLVITDHNTSLTGAANALRVWKI
jgi:glucokinase